MTALARANAADATIELARILK